MTIGIDCRLWNQTGVGRYIRNLVINLEKIDKKNDYVLFIRGQDRDEVEKQLAGSKWRIVITNIKWHSLEEQVTFPRILEKQKLDLMHFPYFSVPASYNKPLVITIHDLIMDHFSTGNASTLALPLYYLKYLAYKYIVKKSSEKAIKIIVPSLATKEEVLVHLQVDVDKIVVAYEAVDDKIIKQKSNFGEKYGKYFLYVGNAYPHKNLDRLIQAFADLKDLKLVLIGLKDYFYKKLEQEYKSDNIIFHGPVTDEELSGLYVNALALVQPSLMEGFGLPILEAMANKCLVVCSDIPSLREIAQDNAIYFNPQDIEDIAKNLKLIAKNLNTGETMVENAFKRSQEFSWVAMAKETLGVYNQALKF